MKRIIAIIGSPKTYEQSATYALANNFIESLKKINSDIESEIIYLSQRNVKSCKGCLVCKQTGKCVINDDMELIRKSMSDADILIFGSPVHFSHVSSVFHNFVERSVVPLHTFEYLGKPFINIVTTNGSGEQEADKFLTKIGLLFGCIKVGSILKSDNDKFNIKAYQRITSETNSILSGKKVQPKLMNKIYFSFMKKVIKENPDYFIAETEIWKQRNWFKKSFMKIYNELVRGKSQLQ